tara:strand:+ start:607 stop:1302 length:696 start_codon:yes stop_codon:yes gene_type:complete
MNNKYLVAAIKPWNISAYNKYVPRLNGQWHLVTEPVLLKSKLLNDLKPRFIFFPHWSWRVSNDVLEQNECVCFHMTDLPYGRGGSPLQNLIVRGKKSTKISALRMVPELDAGPIYMKRDLPLNGSAQEIYTRAADIIFEMIKDIVELTPTPKEQTGPITHFDRRKPKDSELPYQGDLDMLYDHIRMLDAETYPPAFIEHGDYLIKFSEVSLENDTLKSRVIISRKPKKIPI